MSSRPAPLVTVVLPAYDPGERLGRALADVCAQSMPDWECVVVDDGSREDLGWVGELDPRIVLHRQPNAGVSSARNTAVSMATAPLIAFLDQDDRWDPDRLRCAVELAAEHPGAAFWSSQFRWDLPEVSQVSDLPASGTRRWFLAEGGACHSAVTVRRSDYLQVGGQRPELRMCQDFEFEVRLMQYRDAPVVTHPRVLVTYVVHGDNASSDYWRTHQEFRQVYREQARAARAAGQVDVLAACRTGLRLRRRTQAFQAIDAARDAWARQDRSTTLTALSRGFLCSPRVLVAAAGSHLARAVRHP